MATEQRPPQASTARTIPATGLVHYAQPDDEVLADYDRASYLGQEWAIAKHALAYQLRKRHR
jgi:hypothetical protein